MKIVIIPSADLSYNSGSVIYAKKLFEYLLDMGHEVCMLGCCIPKDINEKYKEKIKIRKNLLFHPIINDRSIENIQHLKMGAAILDALIEIYEEWGKIDIIHAHYASINSYIATIFNQFVNTSIVVSSFGRDLNIGYEFGNFLREFITYSYHNVDKIIVTHVGLKNKIINLFSNKNIAEIEICPMPLDPKIFIEDKFVNKEKNEIIFSTINSCFSKEKGIDKIILSFSKVIKRYSNCKLYIAGEDDCEEKTNYFRLQNLVCKLEIQKNIVFTGYLSREDVGRLLNSTDIFIDARLKGNFSSVLIEAEFKHKAILASDNEASKGIISNGENGLLFKVDDENDLEEKMLFLLDNIKSREQIIMGTKEWCKSKGKEYTLEICMGKIIEIYKSVIR